MGRFAVVDSIAFPSSIAASLDWVGNAMDGKVAMVCVLTNDGMTLVFPASMDSGVMLSVMALATEALGRAIADRLDDAGLAST